jgi:hypothetical protein
MLFSHFPQAFLMLINYAMSDGKNPPIPGGHEDHPYEGRSLNGKTGCMSSDDGKDGVERKTDARHDPAMDRLYEEGK